MHYYLYIFLVVFVHSFNTIKCSDKCINGELNALENNENDTVCVCNKGWKGKTCNSCEKYTRFEGLSGKLSNGPSVYNAWEECFWILDTSKPGYFVNFYIEFLEFECLVDRITVYQNSFVDKALQYFSGNLTGKNISAKIGEEGLLYLSFITDSIFEGNGFIIQYMVSECPNSCSGKGDCVNGVCKCNSGFEGIECQYTASPCQNQSSCPYPSLLKTGQWQHLGAVSPYYSPRAYQASVLIDDIVYIIGGLEPVYSNSTTKVHRFNVRSQKWLLPLTPLTSSPPCLFDLSATHWPANSSILVYGGFSCVSRRPSNQLWSFTLPTSPSITVTRWTLVDAKGGLPVGGHGAHLVSDNLLLVLFGMTSRYNWVSVDQFFDLGSKKWSIRPRSGSLGASLQLFHASSVHIGDFIWIYGGLSADLYNGVSLIRYHWPTYTYQIMSVMTEVEHFSFSMVAYNNVLYAFGGHSNIKSEDNFKCYNDVITVMDIACIDKVREPYNVKMPRDVNASVMSSLLDRMGHAGHLWRDEQSSRLVFVMIGGFNGIYQQDVLLYWFGDCSMRVNEEDCSRSLSDGVACQWKDSRCQERSSLPSCPSFTTFTTNVTESVCSYSNSTCHYCSLPGHPCYWCSSNTPSALECLSPDQCQSVDVCGPDSQLLPEPSRIQTVNCSAITSCSICMYQKDFCAWIPMLEQCLSLDQYQAVAVHVLAAGQCLIDSYFTDEFDDCRIRTSCNLCLTSRFCGWCQDKNISSGKGKCFFGGQGQPYAKPPSYGELFFYPDPLSCSKNTNNWYFKNNTCPLCNCNGHSICPPPPQTGCQQPCHNNTWGPTCSNCGPKGYFGIALNGGRCQPCECGGRASNCDYRSGDCSRYCFLKGQSGFNCTQCPDNDFQKIDDSCFYKVDVNMDYTFNPKLHNFEKHQTSFFISFEPTYLTRSIEFSISCHKAFSTISYNLSFISTPLRMYTDNSQPVCSEKTSTYILDPKQFSDLLNKTLLLRLTGFNITATPNLEIKLRFKQMPQVELAYIFVTFFGCFLGLLLVAAAVWNIKQRYDMHRRFRLYWAQQVRMAQRPFAQISMSLENDVAADLTVSFPLTQQRRYKLHKSSPPLALSCIAGIEPLVTPPPLPDPKTTPHSSNLSTFRADVAASLAVVTVFVRMPDGGVMLASSVCSMQNSTKQAFEELATKRAALRETEIASPPPPPVLHSNPSGRGSAPRRWYSIDHFIAPISRVWRQFRNRQHDRHHQSRVQQTDNDLAANQPHSSISLTPSRPISMAPDRSGQRLEAIGDRRSNNSDFVDASSSVGDNIAVSVPYILPDFINSRIEEPS